MTDIAALLDETRRASKKSALDWAYVSHRRHEWEIDARLEELTSRLS